MGELVYLNGWIGPFSEARVSVNDRGYLFGDGIYEVIRAYSGVPFGLDEHLQRLQASAMAVEMTLPGSREEIKEICLDLLKESGSEEAMLYIQVTRGTAPRNHLFDPDIKPNLLVTVRHLPEIPPSMYSEGVKVITLPEFRWRMCNVKTISLQANVLAKHKALKAGAAEVVFVLPDGTVTECGSSNIFMYDGRVLKTHPTGNKILPGITRKYVLDIARTRGIAVKEEPFTASEMKAAEEVFCTNTVHEIFPVIDVDGEVIGQGRPGPVTAQLHKAYQSLAKAR